MGDYAVEEFALQVREARSEAEAQAIAEQFLLREKTFSLNKVGSLGPTWYHLLSGTRPAQDELVWHKPPAISSCSMFLLTLAFASAASLHFSAYMTVLIPQIIELLALDHTMQTARLLEAAFPIGGLMSVFLGDAVDSVGDFRFITISLNAALTLCSGAVTFIVWDAPSLDAYNPRMSLPLFAVVSVTLGALACTIINLLWSMSAVHSLAHPRKSYTFTAITAAGTGIGMVAGLVLAIEFPLTDGDRTILYIMPALALATTLASLIIPVSLLKPHNSLNPSLSARNTGLEISPTDMLCKATRAFLSAEYRPVLCVAYATVAGYATLAITPNAVFDCLPTDFIDSVNASYASHIFPDAVFGIFGDTRSSSGFEPVQIYWSLLTQGALASLLFQVMFACLFNQLWRPFSVFAGALLIFAALCAATIRSLYHDPYWSIAGALSVASLITMMPFVSIPALVACKPNPQSLVRDVCLICSTIGPLFMLLSMIAPWLFARQGDTTAEGGNRELNKLYLTISATLLATGALCVLFAACEMLRRAHLPPLHTLV